MTRLSRTRVDRRNGEASTGKYENNVGEAQGMTSEVATATARRINHESGMVVPARIAAMGNAPAEDVYIVSGEVRMQSDGSVIDRGNGYCEGCYCEV